MINHVLVDVVEEVHRGLKLLFEEVRSPARFEGVDLFIDQILVAYGGLQLRHDLWECLVVVRDLQVHTALEAGRFPEGQSVAQPEGVVGPGPVDHHRAGAQGLFGLGVPVEAQPARQLDNIPGIPLCVEEARTPEFGILVRYEPVRFQGGIAQVAAADEQEIIGGLEVELHLAVDRVGVEVEVWNVALETRGSSVCRRDKSNFR